MNQTKSLKLHTRRILTEASPAIFPSTFDGAALYIPNLRLKKNMSITTTLSLPHLTSHAPLRKKPLLQPMSTLLLRNHHRRRLLSTALAAVRKDTTKTTVWTPAPLTTITPAAESLYHVSIDVSDSPELAGSHTRPGQYLQIRIRDDYYDDDAAVLKPAFLAIASPPRLAYSSGVFEFLVKSVVGSTAEVLCGLQRGDLVELGPVMGMGFDTDRISPPQDFQSVFIFATGSGISPIRSLIESGFSANKRSDVRIYYGARNLKRMAYQDRFKDWESTGVKIVPVLSQPDDNWKGERGYVQAAFSRAKKIYAPQSTGAVLCGQKQMAEEVTSVLVADGVSSEKILKNF